MFGGRAAGQGQGESRGPFIGAKPLEVDCFTSDCYAVGGLSLQWTDYWTVG